MKNALLITLTLLASTSFAGRETHGYLPARLVCELVGTDGPSWSIEFPSLGEVQTEARVSYRGELLQTLSCVDRAVDHDLGTTPISTLSCQSADGHFIEVNETLDRGQAQLWWGLCGPAIGPIPCVHQ